MLTRRTFLKAAAASGIMAAGGGCRSLVDHWRPQPRRPLGNQLNVAVIGAAGQGESIWPAVCASGDRLAALCDVDENALLAANEIAAQASSSMRLYKDFRVMLESERNLDAVIVATPDHGHALQAAWALEKGCHVYVEPPLARTLGETTLLLRKARASGKALRLGDQGSVQPGFCRAVELLRSGIIGAVHEVYAWTSRPAWPQGNERPVGSDPVPDTLDWDLWLCGAQAHPFKAGVYHRYNWRGWRAFGTGALGDTGSHLLSLPFRALDLPPPTSVMAVDVSDRLEESFPKSSCLRFTFDAPVWRQRPPVTLEWYDGGKQPLASRLPEPVQALRRMPDSGCLLLGEDGAWLMADAFGERHFLALAGERQFVDANKHEACAAAVPPAPGPGLLRTFLDEIREGGTAASDPRQLRALTETVLTGCVAQRVQGRLFWKSRKGCFDNHDEANRLVAPEYREGWSWPGSGA